MLESSIRTRGPASRPLRAGAAEGGAQGLPARLLLALVLGLVLLVYVYQFGMNMHSSSGLPYWDDWGYFFGEQQGVQQPLTFNSIFAKDSDHVAPLFKLLTYGLWQAIGVDFLTFRLVGWLSFGAMLAAYAALLLRVCVAGAWSAVPVAAAGIFLLGTANADYFYYQHMGLAQPIFFTCLFLYLHAVAAGRSAIAIVLLLAFGSTGVFGASYVLGAGAAAAVLALRRSGPAGLVTDRRALVAVGAGLLLTAGVLYLTFHGSYANHTGQPLVLPWHRDFWVFLFSAFATAAGLSSETMGPLPYLAGGALLFLAYLGLLPALLLGRTADEDEDAAFCIAGISGGIILVTMVTGLGRANLCGDTLVAAIGCGATPRYTYPVIIGLPAVVAGWLRVAPPLPALRPLLGTALVGVLALGYGVAAGRETLLQHWRVAGLNGMMAERDAKGEACIAAHLKAIRTPGGMDWSRPLTCPSISPRDIAPYLRIAHDMRAAFLQPILAGLDGRGSGQAQPAMLVGATIGADRSLHLALPPVPGRLVGTIEVVEESSAGIRSVIGWAVDLANREPAAHLLVAIGDRVVAAGSTGTGRPDVAKALGDQTFATSGFVLSLPDGEIPPGERMRVFALSRDLGLSELTPPEGLPAVFQKRLR